MNRQLAGSATSQRCAAFPLLASLLTLGSCSAPPFDAAAEEAMLLRRDAEWAEVASAGKDVEKIVSYWSDDAVVIPPGQPVLEGKQAIRAYVESSLKIPGFRIHWKSDKVAFSPDGKLRAVALRGGHLE